MSLSALQKDREKEAEVYIIYHSCSRSPDRTRSSESSPVGCRAHIPTAKIPTTATLSRPAIAANEAITNLCQVNGGTAHYPAVKSIPAASARLKVAKSSTPRSPIPIFIGDGTDPLASIQYYRDEQNLGEWALINRTEGATGCPSWCRPLRPLFHFLCSNLKANPVHSCPYINLCESSKDSTQHVVHDSAQQRNFPSKDLFNIVRNWG